MRLLVLEDQADLHRAAAGCLRSSGHAVDGAPDRDTAESFVRSCVYDVFVLDRLLPNGDGMTLLRQWRERCVLTPALFLTACARVEDRIVGSPTTLATIW
ncbi:response regulator [Lysobacter antibioticus]|uniref:response regulator n=1 Tax=Lysobacter antibioticus TaxID=84531 RepID=UPI00068B0F43|nr:response regulator [Lysobacter antibioticus]